MNKSATAKKLPVRSSSSQLDTPSRLAKLRSKYDKSQRSKRGQRPSSNRIEEPPRPTSKSGTQSQMLVVPRVYIENNDLPIEIEPEVQNAINSNSELQDQTLGLDYSSHQPVTRISKKERMKNRLSSQSSGRQENRII